MAEKSDGAQIVRDEQISRAKFALQSDQKVDDLGACGWIKRRSRLIQYDELRSRNDGAANADTLLLAGAQLHRKLVEHAFGQAKPHDDVARPRVPLCSR